MKCRTVRVRSDWTDDDKPTRRVVSMVLGNMRQVGCIDEEAWVEMSPGMAEEIARDLLTAAQEVRKRLSASPR